MSSGGTSPKPTIVETVEMKQVATLSFASWLMEVDSSGRLLVYLKALEDAFDTVA